MAEITRRTLIDTELESLLQPYPGWETEWIHLGPGPAAVEGVRVTCGSGTITTLHTSSAGILRGVTARESLGLISSPDSAARPRSHARPIGADSGVVLGPAAALDVYLPAGSNVLIIGISTVPLAGEDNLGQAGQARLRGFDAAQGALLSRCLASLEQIRTLPPASAMARDAQRRLRDQLKMIIPTLFREEGPLSRPERTRLQRHQAVIRACGFVDAHLRAPIALMDLCTAAGVSTRALEYGFHDFYGLGPMAYVRNLRLCRVRHDLLDPNRDDHSVSGAARRWSFTHMGQFSHDYRALFGEMPSMTLAAHQRAAKAAPVS